MRRLTMVGMLALGLSACDSGTTDNELGNPYHLTVTERSATTLKLQWTAIPESSGAAYTVDFFALNSCTFPDNHLDVLHVTGTGTTLTGLLPSTNYNIHVHDLPGLKQSTNVILVQTLSAGSAVAPVAEADYQKC
jgi:hypothetical protein